MGYMYVCMSCFVSLRACAQTNGALRTHWPMIATLIMMLMLADAAEADGGDDDADADDDTQHWVVGR